MNEIIDIKYDTVEELEHSAEAISVTPEKPFNECLTCRYLRNGCSGPNLMAMETERMWEFLEIIRKSLGLSHTKIAELTGISPSNVIKNMTGQVKNPSLDTVRAISRVLVGDPKGKYPCALHLVVPQQDMSSEHAKLLEENKELRRELADERVRKDFILKDWEFKRNVITEQHETIRVQGKVILRLMGEDNAV